MTTIVKELRDAPVDAGAKPELADKAAEAVAGDADAATKADLSITAAMLKKDIAELATKVVRELRDQVWKFVGVNAAIAAVVVAAIKLLP
jgi:hypothetical protein